MRLIDADALIPMIKYATIDNEIGVFPIRIGFDAIVKVINEQPTIEAVQERKGRWVDCVGSDHWKCSECGDRAPMYWDANRQEYDEWFSPYCPNCGAKMEGAEE